MRGSAAWRAGLCSAWLVGCAAAPSQAPGGDVGTDDTAPLQDTGDTAWTEGPCVASAEPLPLDTEGLTPVAWEAERRSVAVRVAAQGELGPTWVVVTAPADGGTATSAGSPVVVAVPPASLEQEPGPMTRPAHGLVEVQPILPGWKLSETVEGEGELDHGGLATAQAVARALAFATGAARTVEDWALEDLVEVPVCRPVAVFTASSGAAPVAWALGLVDPEVRHRVAGSAFFEPVSLPSLAVFDPGTVPMDPDPEVDADGNGLPWDDARSWAWQGCTLEGCTQDFTQLAMAAAFAGRPSALFIDGDGDGVPKFDETGEQPVGDVDGNGAVDPDEDVLLSPHSATIDGTQAWVYAPAVLRAAAERGFLSDAGWSPEVVSDLEVAEAWWAERSMVAAMEEWAVAPEHGVRLTWSRVPHGVAWVDRPDIVVPAAAAELAGVPVGLGVSAAALGCAVGEARPEHLGALDGTAAAELTSEDLESHAMEEGPLLLDHRVAGALQVLLDAGHALHCAGG